jgi:hypothetical protein
MTKSCLSNPKKIAAFITWATAQGAEQQALTNEWEILRLRVPGGVAIVYRNKKGARTPNELAEKLIAAWEFGHPLPCPPKRTNARRGSLDERTIRQRDGSNCFYCLLPVPENNATIEHLVPAAHGGPNHLSNKFLAHGTCNTKAGHLSAVEKIKIREKALLAKLSVRREQKETTE